MAMTVLSGHRDSLVGAYFASSGGTDMIYTVAGDGAVFVWEFVVAERVPNQTGEGTRRGSQWTLSKREFLWDPHTEVSSAAFQRSSELLVIGFSNGVYGLYTMPDCSNIHRLSVSTHSLNTVAINSTGEWLALGSSRLGQLIVWEWKSESYALKQQGHLYGLNALDFSSDGQFIATGGDVNCHI
jgi:periodic tryptophan protein 2